MDEKEIILAQEQLPDRQHGLPKNEQSDRLTAYLADLCIWFDDSFEQVVEPAENMGIRLPDACSLPFTYENGVSVLRDARNMPSMQAVYDLDFMATQTNVPNQRTRVLVALDAAVNIPLEQRKRQDEKTKEKIAYWTDVLVAQQVDIPLASVKFFLHQPALLERLLNAGVAFDAIHMKRNEIDQIIKEQLSRQHTVVDDVQEKEEALLFHAKKLQHRMLTDNNPMRSRKPTIAAGNRAAMDHAIELARLLADEEDFHKKMHKALELYHDRGASIDRFKLNASVVERAQEDYQGVAALEAAIVKLWGRFITNITSAMIQESGFYHTPKADSTGLAVG